MSWNGVEIMALGNPDLGWEKTRQLNIGGEISMFDNRVFIGLDVYRKTSDNLLTDVDMNSASGFTSYMANIGRVQNQGFELKASFVVLRNKARGISWTIGANANQNKNKILEISDALQSVNNAIISDTDTERDPRFLYKEGESINTIFAVRSKGIDPSNGQEVYYKLDGSETYTWDKKDLVACGVKDPLLWGTINTTFRYKGLSLTAFLRYTTGGDQYNQTLASKIENINASENADRRALYGRWQKPGDISQFKAVTDNTVTKATTRFVMRDNSLTGQSIIISYDFPREWTKKNLNCQSLNMRLNTEQFFYTGTIKQERGTSYPYANQYSLTVTARF